MNADWSMMRTTEITSVDLSSHISSHMTHMYTNVHESRHPFWLEVVFSKTKTIKNSLLPKAPAPSLLPIEMPMTLPAWIFCTAARAVTSPSLITFKGTSPASSSHVWRSLKGKKTRNCEQNNRIAVGSVDENEVLGQADENVHNLCLVNIWRHIGEDIAPSGLVEGGDSSCSTSTNGIHLASQCLRSYSITPLYCRKIWKALQQNDMKSSLQILVLNNEVLETICFEITTTSQLCKWSHGDTEFP